MKMTFQELELLNGVAPNSAEFDRKWNSFGGLEAVLLKLETSASRGVHGDMEDMKHRVELFGMGTCPVPPNLRNPWLTFWQLLARASCDRKLLIIRIAFFMGLILWLMTLGAQVVVYGTSGNDGAIGDNNGGFGVGALLYSALFIFFVPIFLVLLVTVKNWSLQDEFSKYATNLMYGQDVETISILRNGEIVGANPEDLVVGDICLLKAGEAIPSDGVLIEAEEFDDGRGQLPLTRTFGKSGDNSRVYFIEAGTLVISGSAKYLVTAIGPNTRLARATINAANATASETVVPQTFDKFTEEVRFVSKGLVLGGIVLGAFAIVALFVRFFVHKYVVERQDFHISHLQRMVSFVVACVVVFDIFLQKSFPFLAVVAQLFGLSKFGKGRLIVRNLDDVLTLANISVLANFGEPMSEQIVNKFATAGIRVVTLSSGSMEEAQGKFESRSQAQLETVQKSIHPGEIVAVLGQTDADRLAMEGAHVRILLQPKVSTQTTINSANMIIKPGASSHAEDLEVVLECVRHAREMCHNMSKFIQLLIPAVVIMGLVKAVNLVIMDSTVLHAVPIVWISFLVFIMGLLLLYEQPVTESPFMKREPGSETADFSLVTRTLRRNVIGQIIFQFTILMFIIFVVGPALAGNNRSSATYQLGIGTMAFNTIAVTTLFNAVNCRVIYVEGGMNWKFLVPSKLFCIAWILAFVVQLIIVQFGDLAFSVRALSISEKAVCYVFAAATLVWAQLVNRIPVRVAPQKRAGATKNDDPVMMDLLETSPRAAGNAENV